MLDNHSAGRTGGGLSYTRELMAEYENTLRVVLANIITLLYRSCFVFSFCKSINRIVKSNSINT